MSEQTSAVSSQIGVESFLSPHEVIVGASPQTSSPDYSTVRTTGEVPPVMRVSYDTKHLLPQFALAVLITASAAIGVARVGSSVPASVMPVLTIAIWSSIAALWAFLFFRWAYRGLFWRVEVTEQEVRYHRGWLWPKQNVPLAQLARVEVRQNWWQKLFDFGHLALMAESPGVEAVVLLGITRPQMLAEHLTRRIQQARAANLKESRISVSHEGAM